MHKLFKKIVVILLIVATIGTGIVTSSGYTVRAEETNEEAYKTFYFIDRWDEPLEGQELNGWLHSRIDAGETLNPFKPDIELKSDKDGKVVITKEQYDTYAFDLDLTLQGTSTVKIYDEVDEWNGIQESASVKIRRIRKIDMFLQNFNDRASAIQSIKDKESGTVEVVDFNIKKVDEDGNSVEGAIFDIWSTSGLELGGLKIPRALGDIDYSLWPETRKYNWDEKILDEDRINHTTDMYAANEGGITMTLMGIVNFPTGSIMPLFVTDDIVKYYQGRELIEQGYSDFGTYLRTFKWRLYDWLPRQLTGQIFANEDLITYQKIYGIMNNGNYNRTLNYMYDFIDRFPIKTESWYVLSESNPVIFNEENIKKLKEIYLSENYLGEIFDSENALYPAVLPGKINAKIDEVRTDENGQAVLKDYIVEYCPDYMVSYYQHIQDIEIPNFVNPVITIKETKIPDGYYAKQTEYEVDLNDKEITIVNYKTKVQIAKQDSNGRALSGAVLEIKDSEGNKVTEWTTDGNVKTIEKLKVNEPYTISETTTPAGYKTASDVSFTIKEDGTIESEALVGDTITIVDEIKPVTVTLTKELEGECDEEEFEFYIVPFYDYLWHSNNNNPVNEFTAPHFAVNHMKTPRSISDLVPANRTLTERVDWIEQIDKNVQDFDLYTDGEKIYPYFKYLLNRDIISKVRETASNYNGINGNNISDWFNNEVKGKWTVKEWYDLLNIYLTYYSFWGSFIDHYYQNYNSFVNSDLYENEVIPLLDSLGETVIVKPGETKTIEIVLNKINNCHPLSSLLIYEKDYKDVEEPEPVFWVGYDDMDSNGSLDLIDEISGGRHLKNHFEYTFTNKGLKVHPTGSATITGKKTYNKDMREFSFTLSENGNEIETVKNDSDGNIVFSDINYTEDDIGTHTYTITEKVENIPGIEFDEHEETVTIEVTDNGDGTLKTDIKTDDDGVTFNNTYTATGKVSFTGTKTLTGRDIKDGEFEFELRENDKLIETVKNYIVPGPAEQKSKSIKFDTQFTDEGIIAFSEINYDLSDVGTHIYTITEKKGNLGGVEYDSHTETVTVNVSDNGDGTLNTDVKTDSDGIVFNNTYSASGKATIGGKKTLTGKSMDNFTFVLKEGDAIIAESVNNKDGVFSFKEINYSLKDIGSHTYTITEKNDNKGGVDYDTHTETVVVNVSDNGDGTLNTQIVTDNDGVAFNNKYSASGKLDLVGKKNLANRDMQEFSFILQENGNALQTIKNGVGGEIKFNTISYGLKDVGEHVYTIAEVNDKKPGITYDTHTETIKVNVTDNGDGTLTATPVYDTDGIIFNNEYHASGDVVLEGSKNLTGRTIDEGEFEFELRKDNTSIQTVKNNSDKKFVFDKIMYTESDLGVHEYEIHEKDTGNGGVEYDTHVEKITVTVSDNGDGTLKTEVKTDDDGVVFNNKYNATGTVDITGEKHLTGREFKDEEFEFEIREGDELIESVKNKGDEFKFSSIAYDIQDVGTHTYTISEKQENLGGVEYDSHSETVTVDVSDNRDGTLDVNIKTDDDGVVFNNKYSAIGSAKISGKKVLENRDMDTFEFVLKEGDEVISEVSNLEDGTFEFNEMNYTLEDVGTHTYTVSEKNNGKGGVEYDTHTETVIVDVFDNGDGTLGVNVVYDEDGVVFTNNYSSSGEINLLGLKKFENHDMDAFKFELVSGEDVIQTVENDSEGRIAFESIKYTLGDVGEHEYIIREINDSKENVEYDTHEEKVKIIVSDNGDGTLKVTPEYDDDGIVFTNKYNEPEALTEESTTETPEEMTTAPKETTVQETVKQETVPEKQVEKTVDVKTGDTSILPMVILGICAAAGIGVTGLVIRKRKSE